jgi:competence protein ComEC
VLCVARGLPRLAGVPAVVAGLASLLTVVPPDILVSGDGRLVAVRAGDGGLMLSRAGGGFARETWLRRDGAESAGESWPRAGVSSDGRLDCRPGGCVYSAGTARVAIVRDARLLPAACRDADLVIAAVHLRAPCRRMAGRTLDRFDLFADGAHAVWLAKDGIRIESVRMRRGDRPWVAPRPVS